ncbi:MAG: sugar phosphate nucleotidyltransferase [Candidatus Zixiibacteriota bacterium]
MKVVILAGGQGRRLEPYTVVLPKPLMPVGDYPILEIIIRQLKSYGLKDITLAVGYLGNIIQSFFNNGEKWVVKIDYNFEDKPLGTVGSLSYIKGLDKTFLLMNGDLLTTFDFSKFIEYHKNKKSIATIAVTNRKLSVDYGILEYNQQKELTGYVEKPDLDYKVSMGIYLFEPEILEYIPKGERLDFPELMNILLKNGKKVSVYESDDFWLDLGRPEDYKKGIEEFEKIKDKLFK